MDGIIAAALGFLGVVVGALLTGYFQQRKVKADSQKTEAEANEQIRQTVLGLIKPLQDRIDQLEQEVADWQDWASRLVSQIKGMGKEPVPFKTKKPHA